MHHVLLDYFYQWKGQDDCFISFCIALMGKSTPKVFPALWKVSYLHLIQTAGLLSTNLVVKKKCLLALLGSNI